MSFSNFLMLDIFMVNLSGLRSQIAAFCTEIFLLMCHTASGQFELLLLSGSFGITRWDAFSIGSPTDIEEDQSVKIDDPISWSQLSAPSKLHYVTPSRKIGSDLLYHYSFNPLITET